MSSSMGSLGERRGRGSGTVASKPCPVCEHRVVIDPRVMSADRDGLFQVCGECGGRVPVRHSDATRRVPVDASPESQQPRRQGRWLRRSVTAR